MSKPRLLDLFCGAGGCAVGYHRAGFEVTGVDNRPMPRYPYRFIQADAIEYIREHGHEYDAIHASPPCQAYVSLSRGEHPQLIEPTREALERTGKPYAIENVTGAPLRFSIMLCGSMFGLHVRRHRLFESNVLLWCPYECSHRKQGEIRAYYGKRGWCAWKGAENRIHSKERQSILYRGSVEEAPADMGIDWMTWDELTQAIPPVFTEFVGRQLLQAIT